MQEDNSNGAKYFADILPRLGVLRIVIAPSSFSSVLCFTNNTVSCLTDLTTNNDKQIEHVQRELLHLHQLKLTNIIQCTHIIGDGIHVRFKMIAECLNFHFNVPELPDKTVIQCLFCREVLTEDLCQVHYKPSCNVDELASEFFCHASHEHSQSLPSLNRDGVLITQDKCKLEIKLCVLQSKVLVYSNSKVCCTRCRNTLGIVQERKFEALFYENDCKLAILDTERVSLLDHTMHCSPVLGSLRSLNDSIQQTEHRLAHKLLTLSREQQCYQFMVRTQEDVKFVYISCLNGISSIASNCTAGSLMKRFVGYPCGQSEVGGTFPVLKIRFSPFPTNKMYSVEPLILPSASCCTLLLLLLQNHLSLPPSMRKSCNLKLGYLRINN